MLKSFKDLRSESQRTGRSYSPICSRGRHWHTLQERGFEDYVQVLGSLCELGLRPPVAPMEGPNREARERRRAIIRQALRAQR